MTLDKVEMDLKSAFDYGMVYVALSRSCSLEGMRLLSFDKRKIKASPEAIDFLDQIKQSQQNPIFPTTTRNKRKFEETEMILEETEKTFNWYMMVILFFLCTLSCLLKHNKFKKKTMNFSNAKIPLHEGIERLNKVSVFFFKCVNFSTEWNWTVLGAHWKPTTWFHQTPRIH